MRRIHLFELEDFTWFPHWLRKCMTRLLVVVHKILGSGEMLARVISKVLKESNSSTIIDLCSGSGGPMPEVKQILNKKYGLKDPTVILTDLYPDLETAKIFNDQSENNISYQTIPVDATTIAGSKAGLRTMVGSFHHMKPEDARKILESAQKAGQPVCIFEIIYNSLPAGFWWVAFPFIFVMAFFITPMVRPITWQQVFFTYVIPIIPICFAWDGAVSSARMYTVADLDELLNDIESKDYRWETHTVGGKLKQLYLLGMPKPDGT